MKRVFNFLVFLLIFVTYSYSGYAACTRKVFDPLEPINKTVPPNILVVVDNSGSMAWDTRNVYIRDHRYARFLGSPTTGDYYHYNLPYQNTNDKAYYVPHYSRFDYRTPVHRRRVRTNMTLMGQIDVPENGEINYVGIAVDIWVRYNVYNDRTLAQITIRLEHNGVTAEITPTDQWFAYRYSSGDDNDVEVRRIHRRWYYRLRVQYAFPDFHKMDKSGTWKLYLKTNYTGNRIYYDRFGLTFNPIVNKVTALKTVLQRIFTNNPNVRFALGTYRAGSRYSTVWDGDGLRRYSNRWGVINPAGLSIWESWPSDEIDTQSNRDDVLAWVDMKITDEDEYFNGGLRKEIFASGFTPIRSCFVNIRQYLNSMYGEDSFQSCRNYAVIFLTDGQCWADPLGCDNNAIRDIIQEIYQDHVISVGTTNRGTKTYVIGLSLRPRDRQWLDSWADAGDDGDYTNHSAQAYMPQNADELEQAFADAIHSASAQEVVINSDVIFGTISPEKAPSGSIFKANQFTTPSGHVFDGTYPAIEANIMFTTKIFYPSWEGDLVAYMPMYRSATDHKIYYFPQDYDPNTGTYKPDYPKIWSAREELSKRLNGYEGNHGHVPGIRDALGLTTVQTSDSDTIPWRNIKLIYPAGQYPNFTMLNLTSFVYDSNEGKWVPSQTLINQVASIVYAGDSNAEEKAKKFIEFVQARMLADITYSSPATIYEPNMGFEDWRDSYMKFKIVERNTRTPVVVIGANDGMLHAFNAYTGREEWAIIPWGVIDSLKDMVANYDPQNNPSGQVDVTVQDALGRNMHIYGVASSPKIVDIGHLNDDNPDNDSWNTVLVCGLGGGGNSYFCLDVTDPLHPQVKWDTSTSADFSDMGETWAYPAMWLTKLDDDYKTVGFFTSGYSVDTDKGKSLYIVNIDTGELMDKKDLLTGSNKDFLFASPAGILDVDARFIKGVYVGSTYGELFRYDLLNDDVCEVFDTRHNYSIVTLPAVYVDSSNHEWVSLAEFGCEDAFNGTFAKNAVLYTIKAYPENDCNGHKNLIDITSQIDSSNFNTTIPLGGKDGYYFKLQRNETMFADPLITTYFYEDQNSGGTNYETVSVFVTYKYPSSGDYCGLGNSYLYIFGVTDLFVGTRENNQDTYGSRVSKGRSGSPVKTGVSGTVWINTPDGPLRILPLDDSAGSSSIPVYSPFAQNCTDAKKVGAGSWIVY